MVAAAPLCLHRSRFRRSRKVKVKLAIENCNSLNYGGSGTECPALIQQHHRGVTVDEQKKAPTCGQGTETHDRWTKSAVDHTEQESPATVCPSSSSVPRDNFWTEALVNVLTRCSMRHVVVLVPRAWCIIRTQTFQVQSQSVAHRRMFRRFLRAFTKGICRCYDGKRTMCGTLTIQL